MVPTSDLGRYIVPCWQSDIPVSLYINGRQVPPIEATGKILHFTFSGLKIRCEQKIPIPSQGTIRFAFANVKDPLEMRVDFVQRLEKETSFWKWKSKKIYEIEVTLSQNQKEKQEHYQHLLHRIFFGATHQDED